jgi:hypothetical protein
VRSIHVDQARVGVIAIAAVAEAVQHLLCAPGRDAKNRSAAVARGILEPAKGGRLFARASARRVPHPHVESRVRMARRIEGWCVASRYDVSFGESRAHPRVTLVESRGSPDRCREGWWVAAPELDVAASKWQRYGKEQAVEELELSSRRTWHWLGNNVGRLRRIAAADQRTGRDAASPGARSAHEQHELQSRV